MANANDILKDRKVLIIGGAVLALLILGGVFYFVSQNSGGANSASSAASAPGAPGAPPAPAGLSPRQAAQAAGRQAGAAFLKMSQSQTGGAPAAAPKASLDLTNSFSDAPGSAGAPGAPGVPGAPPAPATPSSSKPDPIKEGVYAAGFRADPFISFTKRIVEDPPAYSFEVPFRLASRPRPVPVDPTKNLTASEIFGPLPYVQRRVAGILTDGSVSAILETGPPGGASTDVHIIQPGATIPSGSPYVGDLTVASITPTEVVLRALDGRTTTVKLSNVPGAYADQFHAAAGGAGAAPAGGAGPGGPGGPGGPDRDAPPGGAQP